MVVELQSVPELEHTSFDDMVSVKNPSSLPLNSPTKLSPFGRSRYSSGSATSPGSPEAWKNSLEELSKNLKRICSSSSSRESLHSPLPATPRSPAIATNGDSSKRNSDAVFDDNSPPGGNTDAMPGKRLLRVRHEESQDTLQKRLSQISGYKSPSPVGKCDVMRHAEKRHGSKDIVDMARIVSQRASSNGNRVNIVVNTDDTPHENLTVACHNDELIVSAVGKPEAGETNHNVGALLLDQIHRENIPAETEINRLMCVHTNNELHIRERSKQVVSLEVSKSASADSLYCPVFTWENNWTLWKMSWYLDGKYNNQNITVKTVDSKLIIVCRSKRLSMLPMKDHALISEELIRNAFNQNGAVAMKYRGGIQLSLDLPEGVDARTIAAHITEENQLIVEGKQLGLNERCMTL